VSKYFNSLSINVDRILSHTDSGRQANAISLLKALQKNVNGNYFSWLWNNKN